MAMASFCGMEICTGFAESCFPPSLLRDLRNWSAVSVGTFLRPRSVALWMRHNFTILREPCGRRDSAIARPVMGVETAGRVAGL